MSLMMAFCIVLATLTIGDLISTKTKAVIPSVFVCAVLFLLGFWTFFPPDIVALAGFQTPIVVLSILLLITHLGTMLSISELIAQWKTIVISVRAVAGIVALVLTAGAALFGWQAAVAGAPPLTGGLVATVIMGDAATQKGLPAIAVLATLVFVIQGFIGYPIGSMMLKKEAQRLVRGFRESRFPSMGEAVKEVAAAPEEAKNKFSIFPSLPSKYVTTYMLLFKLGLVAWAAVEASKLTNGKVSQFVICLVFGVIAAQIGFIERKPLNTSNSFGFLITVLMAYVFSSLAKATPSMVMELIGPTVGIVVIGIIGIYFVCFVLGKLLGESKEMSFAIGLNALFGFPPNYILTDEAAKAIGENEQEVQYIMDKMLPKMLVGGFVTVTICSVIIAGMLAYYL